ncbi:anhydro-N-acetylmuramic acid kinase [Negadavirga shengliensis]|uniref:Anhydro-N-acetylmuramic acid kinase n=1 Tax=Negadavirga shengliensis TaxID=1389218 RepID=A0ABV9SXW5_9BACT
MAEDKTYPVIGLMSGTSGDGLDMAYCVFEKKKDWTFDITQAQTVPFPLDLGDALRKSHQLSSEDLALLDVSFGEWMGNQVKAFCKAHKLAPLFIASHGHTVFHRPEKKLTKQIGNGYALWQAAGVPVINDFRSLDVVLGGQGAPLVPIGDKLLFGSYDYCLNLGGIANISHSEGQSRIAYDVCPFNLLLNHYASRLGLAYDEDGLLAAEGEILPELLEHLEKLAYYRHRGAKSLGREDIEETFLPLLEKTGFPVKNILATLSDHFANRIAETVLKTHSETGRPGQLLVTGGGAYNQHFIEKLSEKLAGKTRVVLPEKKIIDFKEAMVFAFLGVLRTRGENNCLASVTGAASDNCGGTLYGFLK